MTLTADLKPKQFPQLSWSDGDTVASLDQLCKYVTGEANEAINWYERRRAWKKRGARFFRVGAILATAVAGVIPILSEIFKASPGWPISAGWASIAVAGALLLITLDRFAGFTSAWVRYLLAGQELGQILEAFRMEWEEEKLAWGGPQPTLEQTKVMVAKCKAFLIRVHALIREETLEWAVEFENVVRQIDRAAKPAAKEHQIAVSGLHDDDENQ